MKIAFLTLMTSILTASTSSFAAQIPQDRFHLIKLDLILSARNFTIASTFQCENQNSRIIQQRILTAVARAQNGAFNEFARPILPGSPASVSSLKLDGTDDAGAKYSVTLEMPRTKLNSLAPLTAIQLQMKDLGRVVCAK